MGMARLLLAEGDDALREMLHTALERDGFDVVAVSAVRRALRCIATEKFDALLSDLNMPPHADAGFTVVSAMRHTHPDAVTLLLNGHPELDRAVLAICSQADDVLVKPIEIASVGERIHQKLANRVPHELLVKQSVASILEQCLDATIQGWMKLVGHDEELNCVPLTFEDRVGHLPNLLADLISRLLNPLTAKANISIPAREHGVLRRKQGYTAAMLVEECRILQISIFNTLQANLRRVNVGPVLLDVIRIANEVDSQLKQAMLSFVGPGPWSVCGELGPAKLRHCTH
jgi:ActR/RegA family two-component response regulator